MSKPLRMRRPGFTLVEILVAVLILSIGLISLAEMYVASMWSYQKARAVSLATERAKYELEKAENFGFNTMSNSANLISDTIYPSSEGYSELPANNGVQFNMDSLSGGHGTITVSNFHGNANLLQVVISITWTGPPKTITPVQVTTLLAE